ncbi:MAG: hypothetical protein KME13_07305 [Myxacorys californica WJT36-NPBG1]|nr:hypothetical protein [Myxacorys californica WJT36-NPBG1]
MLDASSSENASLANRSPSVPLETDATSHHPHEVELDLDTREPSSRFNADRDEQPIKSDRFSVSRHVAHPDSLPAIGDDDLSALTFLFDRYEMSEVEADLDRALAKLTPEPYWEDEELEVVHHD